MVRRLAAVTASFAVLLGLAVSAVQARAGWAPPTDDEVAAAVKTFSEKMLAARSAGSPATPELMARTADEAIGGMDISAMSGVQINTLIQGRLLPLAGKAPAFLARLGELAKATDAAGAEAAVMRLYFLRLDSEDPSKDVQAIAAKHAEMLRTALRHPSLQRALQQGKGGTIFASMRAANPLATEQVLPDILALDKVLTTDMPAQVALSAPLMMDTLLAVGKQDETARAAREPLRVRLLELIRAAKTKADAEAAAAKTEVDKNAGDEALARAATETARTAENLARAEKKVDGPFMRGTLVGGPAPNLDFIWSNTNPPIKTLADLKGKVVVLDFWATWCGPCVGSFPDVAKLQAHYDGYPVVILGVTSIQGSHTDASGQRTELKGQPEKEVELMTPYIKDKGITWTIAFSKQEVFNPEYGITGIPHVALLDAKGVVRYRGLHPNSKWTSFEEKVEKIDGLLKEAGLPTPPPLPPKEDKKDDQPKGG